MSKKIRIILLTVFTFLFLVIAPQLILYSMGYRFDFEKKKLVNTGGLYFKISPSGSEIFIDGKFKEKIGFFSSSALIQNLLPKKHDVLIKKGGYHSWQKSLEIKGKEVTRVENILLVKENPAFEIFQEDINNFFISPNGKTAVLEKITKDGSQLEVFDLKSKKESKSFSFPNNIKEIADLKWSFDSERILVKAKSSQYEYFLLDLNTKSQTPPQAANFLDETAYDVSFDPNDSQILFFIKNNILYSNNVKTSPVFRKIITYAIAGNNIIWLENSGFIYRSDFLGQTNEVLNIKPFPIAKNNDYKIITGNEMIFLKENDTISTYNQDSKTFEKFYSPARDLIFSPDLKKMLYFNDYEIWFLNLGQKPEPVFLTRFSERIENCSWLNPYYLIFSIGNQVKISEIDTRDKVNIADLTDLSLLIKQYKEGREYVPKTSNNKTIWNQADKKLYLLIDNVLFSSEKLIP